MTILLQTPANTRTKDIETRVRLLYSTQATKSTKDLNQSVNLKTVPLLASLMKVAEKPQ